MILLGEESEKWTPLDELVSAFGCGRGTLGGKDGGEGARVSELLPPSERPMRLCLLSVHLRHSSRVVAVAAAGGHGDRRRMVEPQHA